MTNRKRAWLAGIVLGLLALPTLLLSAPQREKTAPPKDAGKMTPSPSPASEALKDTPSFSHFITLPTDPDLKKKLDAVQDYVASELWDEVTQLLQIVLDSKEDVFLPIRRKGADGKEIVHWRSGRAEVNRLLGALPPQGREFYELTCGPKARALLAEAKKSNDLELLAQMSQRYLHTEAGAEATHLLGTHHLDRGRFLMAALSFERLLQHPKADKLPPLALFQAALAFHRAGDKDNAEMAWKRLALRAPDGFRVGDKMLSLEALQKELDKQSTVSRETAGASDWSLFRGNAGRFGLGVGTGPRLESKWQQPTITEAYTLAWVEAAVERLEGRSQPILPAFFPVAAGGKIFYRNYRGIQAVEAKSGKFLWASEAKGSLDLLSAESKQVPYLSAWIDAYLPEYAHVVFENAVLGTLSADGFNVYTVDDLAVPPFPNNYSGFHSRSGQGLQLALAPTTLADAVYHNRLLALDQESGKVAWEVGGRGEKQEGGALNDSYFLSTPLPLGGKLYVLNEKDQDIRLLCLEAATGTVAWTQKLATPKTKLLLDGGRRMQAAHLAYGDGILVCPTNAGALLGVDLLSHSLLWAYAYREEPPPLPAPEPGRRRPAARAVVPQAPPNLHPEWRTAGPVVQEGKVVFTAPDEASVQCLSLREGSLLWKAKREPNDLYLAGVYKDKVLIVGKQECRALSLKDGREVWKVETGQPSGQGVAGGNVYYLPLKAGAEGKEPAVYAIDLDKGTVLARTPSPKKEVPGNLFFHDGDVLSQTATTLTAYPQESK